MQQKLPAKERIVGAARQLFAERGFHRTSMADLAEFASVSVGAIYRAFPGKSEIIRAIIQDDTEKTLAVLEAAIAQVRSKEVSGASALEDLLSKWVSVRIDALDHEVVAESHRNPEIAQMLACICARFREIYRTLALLIDPNLDDATADGIAELLLVCQFGMGNREFTAPRLTETQTAAVVSRLILQGIACEAR